MIKAIKRALTAVLITVCIAGAYLATVLIINHKSGAGDGHRIVHAKIGRHDLYIPHDYIRFPYTSVGIGGDSGLIQAYYPGDAPVPGNETELWRKGQWYKNVRIYFEDLSKYPEYDIERGLMGQIKLFNATRIVEKKYGLTYQTQPFNIKITFPNEIWIEKSNGKVVSFIECREKYAEGIVPQCSHRFRDGPFSYVIDYDKRLLPEWRLIRSNALSLMKSFDSEADARAFFVKKTLENKETSGEKR